MRVIHTLEGDLMGTFSHFATAQFVLQSLTTHGFEAFLPVSCNGFASCELWNSDNR